MQPVLNIEDIKSVERNLASAGVSISELMHRAGAAAAQEVMSMESVKSVAVLVGFGNNGGDGWVAASVLKKNGFNVKIISPIPLEQLTGDLCRVVAAAARNNDIEIVVAPPREELEDILYGADVVLDAIFGTGFHGMVEAPFDIWIDTVNTSGCRVVSVDVPSGLSAQTGHAANTCIVADETVTMLALKPGLLADEARDVCGNIVVAPLAEQTEQLVLEADPVAWRSEAPDYFGVISTPTAAQDKYSRGSVLVVAGSARYPGAAIMAAKAAARSGVGYVTLAVPACIVPVVQSHLLSIPVVGLASDERGMFASEAVDEAGRLAEKHDSVLVGCGMGVSAACTALVTKLLETNVPLVVDADGLNCIARLCDNRLDNFPELIRRTSPLIFTPHAKELGRLMGLCDTPPNSLTSSLEAARRIVWANGGSEFVIMAKGSATACVAVEVALLPKPGPECLATAGSGDVLAGLVTGLLAHNKPEIEDLPLLCALAVETHGCAAALAAKRFGSQGVVATDIIDEIGVAIDTMYQHAAWSYDYMSE